MKSLLKFISAVTVLAMACLTVGNVNAQQTVATWYCGPLVDGGGAAPAPFTNNTASIGVIVTPITKGPGIGAVTTGDAYGGNTWTNAGIADSETNSIANGLYISYAIQAAPGYLISFSTNYMFVHASSTGPHNSALQYSTDGVDFTDVMHMTIPSGTSSTVWTNVLSTNSFLQNIPSSVTNYFRIVNWGATGTAGTWYIYDPVPSADAAVLGTNDVVVNATLTAVGSLATWYCGPLVNGGGAAPAPFTNNTAPVGVIVTPITKGPGVGAVTTGDAYGGNSWTNAGIADSEANSIANGLYVSYAIQAATNYTISFYTNYVFVHASGTGPHNSALQYSTDGVDFTDLMYMTIPSGSSSTVWTNVLSTNGFLQNIPSTVTNYFRIVNWGATGTAGTWYIYDPFPSSDAPVLGTNDFVISGGLSALLGFFPSGSPTNVVLTPSNSITANAGATVNFSVSAGGNPASNFWYQIVGSTTNLIAGPASSTLTLTNVLETNAGNYFVVLTNSYGVATSSIVSLTVIDPFIQVQPSSVQGLVDGTVQFGVTAAGTTPLSYQWYYTETNGTFIAPTTDGAQSDGSGVFGSTNSILTLTNLQTTDLTNFVVVVTNFYGSVTSSVASFISRSNVVALALNQGVLALWDFDGPQFTNTAANPNSINNPAPFVGYGAASAVGTCLVPGTSPFSGATDPNDIGNPNGEGFVFTPYGFDQLSPNFSWGTEDYPAETNYPDGVADGGNKQNGVEFSVSTIGAKNIHVAYDSRVSSTASDYERLQYTTNGVAWIDYPASSTFSGLYGSGNAGFYTFNYSLVGFPGVDNNPNFAVRVVTEWQSTATYGVGTTNNWVGTANSYTSGASSPYAAGTVTYDIVAFTGDAITNNNTPPIVSSFVNTNMVDTNTLVIPFSASSLQMPSGDLTVSAQVLNTVAAGPFTQTINPQTLDAQYSGSTNFTLTISFGENFIPDPADAAPILVTVTDTNGESASAWFILTATALNQPPTNTLTAVQTTNLLANTSLAVPFFVGGGTSSPASNFTFTITSDNNTVIPAGNVVISGNTNTGNLVLTVTPATNQVGNAVISVAVDDNNPAEPRTTTANIACVVRPNTNVVAIDYFNYDQSGSLDTIAASYWTHLSGVTGQLQAGNGVATVSDQDTENLQAQLINGAYQTNSGKTLYYSCTVNMNPSYLPYANGSYFIMFNDGSGITADVEDCLVATTNGVATPGDYRLGIANVVGANGTTAQIVNQDLVPGSNYVVITSLVLSNGFSSLWINPTNQSSPSVTDHTPAASPTNLNSIADIELRESGTSEGVINVGRLTVGTAFNSVFYPPQANPDTFGVTENSSGNILNPLPNDAGSDLTIVSLNPDTNGTATISNGTNVIFSATNTDFVGVSTIGYTIMDDLGETNSSTITVTITNAPPLAKPATYTVLQNSANNVFNVLTNDVLETPGGALGLVSVNETDGNGTPSISGTNVDFTPTANFVGVANIGYTITDNVGGTNSSSITVNVNPASVSVGAALISNGNLVLTWSNSAFNLQTATNVLGPWLTIPDATSPYTNVITTNAAGFFRLEY